MSDAVLSGQLVAFIERIERLAEDRKAIAEDLRQVFAEIKGSGLDGKTIRTIVKLRAQDPAARAEQQTMLDLYLHAIGQPDLFQGIETDLGHSDREGLQ